jgi:hypothetical protein
VHQNRGEQRETETVGGGEIVGVLVNAHHAACASCGINSQC